MGDVPADISHVVDTVFPELAPLRRTATILRPEPGGPGRAESSLGGPPLWPADDPWPHCAEQGHYFPDSSGDRTPVRPVPMVPVLQVFARDVPELPFPEGRDLLQVVWCTLLHPADRSESVRPRLYWRTEAEVLAAGVLTDVPAPAVEDIFDEFLPPPCVLSPVTVHDYPNWGKPEELQGEVLEERMEVFAERTGRDYTDAACALETKIGGYPAWSQPPDWPDCPRGHRMEHLASVTADHGMDMGDLGGVYLFVCRRCPDLPSAHRYDC
ncbi:protein of unknown function [Actinacidiphila yanglinensis]|uniref:DUF1963 domain-containing protein n=1 Tax=Actinacidiphila yanglinensis TaxID=310779 RepID=A0A1H6E135_9ACTN|nr:DUF1963 domain-containing protein [Actinacidiphila yanglinensis]SEG91272.1 protein of unknown function [Actinacidiphila yanglinensis]